MVDIAQPEARTGRGITSIWGPRPAAFAGLQIAGLAAAAWALASGVDGRWWLLSLAVYFATTCLGMAIAVHRGLAHRAFEMARPVERLFCFFAAIGGTGSPIGWIAVHRAHHATADTEDDPHGPGNDGWRLLVRGAAPRVDWWRVRDLLRDPFQRYLHAYYTLILAGWALALALIHPLAAVFGFLIPAGAQITVTNLSTILGHGWGYRNFETRDDSTNNWLIAALTWGEGWHNNHHARPRSWTMSARRWEIDPAGWIIRALAAAGLVRGGPAA